MGRDRKATRPAGTKSEADTEHGLGSAKAPLAVYFGRAGVALSVLAALTFTLYSGTLGFAFVWDDHPQIVNNPLIRSWHSLGRVFTNDLWFHTGRGQLYYRPMFIVWSILNYSLFGLRTWGWHLGAVLLHAAAPACVYLLARKTRLDHWTAVLAAAIFALHPVHIECAAWISAASDTLVTIFYVLAFVAFLNSCDRDSRRTRWRLLSLVLLAGGLLTKEMAITFPVMIAVYAWLFLGKGRAIWQRLWDSVLAAVPYGALVVAYLVVRKIALRNTVAAADPFHTTTQVLLTLPAVLFQYLRNLLLPVGMTGLYFNPYVSTPGLRSFVLPLAALAGFALLVRYWAKRCDDPGVIFYSAWTLITLAPVLYLRIFPNGDFVRDRYVYLPSVGFIVLAAKAVRLLPAVRQISWRTVQAAMAVVICAAMAVGCLAQQVYWGTELLVFARGHELYPESQYATVGLANALGNRGAYARSLELLQRAAADSQPGEEQYRTMLLLAEAYARVGRIEEGRRTLDAALKEYPNLWRAELEEANLAGLLGRLQRYDQALALCKDVLQREPDLYAALYNCGNVNLMAGRYSDAERLLSRAVRATPNQAAPHYFLGRALLANGRYAEAETSLRRAADIDPNDYEVHVWLGDTLQRRGALREAHQQFLSAFSLNSDDPELKQRLSSIEQQLTVPLMSQPDRHER